MKLFFTFVGNLIIYFIFIILDNNYQSHNKYQKAATATNRDDMMKFLSSGEHIIINPAYCQPQGKQRASDVNLNVARPETNKSSDATGFNVIDFSLFDVNLPTSSIHIIRWNFEKNWIDQKCQQLFNGNLTLLNNFISKESELLQRIRDNYSDTFYKDKMKVDERREFQPIFQTFLFGFLQDLCVLIPSCKRTVAAANGVKLQATFPLREPEEDETTSTEFGFADLFVLRGESDACIDLTRTQNNVEVLVELKSPYSSLYHTANRAVIDQITAEVEGLSQTLKSIKVVKGVLTDLNSISLHIRVKYNQKIFHCVSHRIVEVEEYIKQLILICCCTITVQDLKDSIAKKSVIDISESKYKDDVDDEEGGDGRGKKKRCRKGYNDDDDKEIKPSPYPQRNRKPLNHQTMKRSKMMSFYDYDEEVESLQMLLDHDAKIRGIKVIREGDLIELNNSINNN